MTDGPAKPAIPFAGKLKVIAPALSTGVNSGIRGSAVLTPFKSQSQIRHGGRGWGFLASKLGDHVDIAPAQPRTGESGYSGKAGAVCRNLNVLREAGAEQVLILAGGPVYKMDCAVMLAEHVAKGAEKMVACIEVPLAEASNSSLQRQLPRARFVFAGDRRRGTAPDSRVLPDVVIGKNVVLRRAVRAMKIRMPADGPELVPDAVRHALWLKQEGLNADFVLATMQEPTRPYERVLASDAEVLQRVSGAAGRHALEGAEALFMVAGTAFEPAIGPGLAAPTLTQLAERLGGEAIGIAAGGNGALRSALLGSLSRAVLHASKVPITTVKHRGRGPCPMTACGASPLAGPSFSRSRAFFQQPPLQETSPCVTP